MDYEKSHKLIKITIKMKIEPEYYEIVKQDQITSDNDEGLITGIYKFLLLKEDTYIVCCNRGDNTLDYTRFAGTQKMAEILYEQMLKEIEKDLNRS